MNWFTDEDKKYLESFDDKNRVIRDTVRTIVSRKYCGFYLYGPPGTSKSHTVIEVLKEEEAAFEVLRSHVTGPGMFTAIRKYPHATIVLEDVNSIFRNEVGKQILASAMAESADGERWVEHNTASGTERCLFMGAIIAMSNRPLGRDPFSEAIASRMMSFEYSPTQPELKSLLKHIAITTGLKGLSIEESKEVVSFLLSATEELGKALDLRHADKAAGYFLTPEKESHWHDLVVALLKGKAYVDGPKLRLNRRETKEQDQEIALEIVTHGKAKGWDMTKMKEVWTETTGKCERTFYRRFEDLEEAGLIESSRPSHEDKLARLRLHIAEDGLAS